MTKQELIKEAERLYKQIDEMQLDLVKSRLDVCEERKWKTIYEMETAMCAVFQFLKCIIERKDNIVDLGEAWHDITEEPKIGALFVAQIGKINYEIFFSVLQGKRLSEWFDGCNIKRWAYLDDLLPKGGE